MKRRYILPWLTFLIIVGDATIKVDAVNPTAQPCPNSPIPPTYNQPVQVALPYQPVSSHQACATSCAPVYNLQCSNICQSLPSCPPCPTCACCTPVSTPCSTTCLNPLSCPPCSTMPTRCPTSPNSPSNPITCPNIAPITPTPPTPCSTPSTPSPTSSTPYPTLPTPCPTQPQPPTCPPITPLPPILPPLTPQPPTTTPPPDTIMECPRGTKLINGVCRLVYCGTQSIYREGICIRIECPEGAYWSGSRCETPPEPFVHNITFKTNITTQVNTLSAPLVINNVNNVTVNSTPSINKNISNSAPFPCTDDCEIEKPEPEEPPRPFKCCTVVTPRVCKPSINGNSKKWHCYSKRYNRCDDICVAPTVLLKAPYPTGTTSISVLPPENYITDCRRSRTCADSDDMYDCSGCVTGRPESCSSYCYRSICPPHRCRYYNQMDFCTKYPGQQGCLQEDGCFDDWCGSY